MLARATTRGPELAVRTALGAGRRRLVRQLLTESLLVAALGGALGLLLGAAGVRAFVLLLPGDLPRVEEIGMDGPVLLVALGVTLLAGIAVGLAPALQAPQRRLALGLREGVRGGASGAGRRLREALVVAEFALALTVLVGAALCVGSLRELQRVDAGVSAEGVLVARVSLPEGTFPEEAQVEQYLARLTERVAQLPGVTAASVGMAVPPDRLVMRNPFTPQGATLAPDQRAPLAEELIVGSDYFRALGVPILAGRAFGEADRDGAPPVAIVNETLARRHFPGGDAVGRWLQTGDPDPDATRLAIVGVVPDVKYAGLDADPAPTIYVPYRQNLWWRTMYLVVRGGCPPAAGGCDPLALAAPVRAAAAETDARVPLQDVRTMDRLLFESVAAPRFRAGLLASFGLIALALATAGIYGVVSYGVTQQRRETAVRLALGAQPRDVVRQVVGGGLRLALGGIAVGIPLSLLGTRLLRELLFGVSPLDPATYVGTAAFLAALGVAACAVPARRATHADPSAVLRAE
jgi:predicted permease